MKAKSYPATAFEILVIDNGSTDQTADIVVKLQQQNQRIARGRKQLMRLGLRPYAPSQEAHDLVRYVRRRAYPANTAWPQVPTQRQCYQLILMHNCLLWQQWWICYVG